CARGARCKATCSDEALERERPVRAAEAERVRDRNIEASLASLVRRVVEIALGILLGQVDRRRNHLVAQSEARENSLCRARGAATVASAVVLASARAGVAPPGGAPAGPRSTPCPGGARAARSPRPSARRPGAPASRPRSFPHLPTQPPPSIQ